MKRLILSAVAALALVSSVACNSIEPNAGEEYVLVQKPMFVGHGGIVPDPVRTGQQYVALSTEGVKVNMQPIRIDVPFDDMMTKTGVPVDFHIVVTVKITDSVKLVKDFGADVDEKGNYGFWVRNLDQPFRTAVRDAVKEQDMNDIAIKTTAVGTVQKVVEAALQSSITKTGVPIIITPDGINVGRVNPPDSIKHQRVETATQEQRIITEQQRRLAEDQRKMAEESRAAADNAYNKQMGLSPEQYVRLEQIKALASICGAQGGKGCTFVSGVQPLLGIQ